jgi:tRNA(fMet)-specific endonuclease VapC
VIVLDTDHIGIIQRRAEPQYSRLAARLRQPACLDFFVTIISFHEQVSGWNSYLHRAKTPQDVVRAYNMFARILNDFAAQQVLPFDQAAADAFQLLRKQGVRIGTMDLRIAAIALSRNSTLLSRNLVDFGKVPGLTVEDWTAPWRG